MSIDRRLATYFSRIRGTSAFADRIWIFAARYLVGVTAGIVFLTWVHQPAAEELRRVGLMFAALVASWAVTLILSVTIQRARPFRALRKKPLFRPLIETPSFPSAHATIAFSIAATAWVFDPIMGAIGAFLAAIVAYARMYIGVHYLSDILAGAVVGSLVTWAFHFVL